MGFMTEQRNENCVLQRCCGKFIDIWCIMLGLDQRTKKELKGNIS